MTNKLFIYGSLLQTNNEFGSYLKKHATLYKQGRLKGKLYDAGDYPGAIANVNEGFYIYGSILQLDDPVETLKHIDDYEGFGDDQLQPNLFLRELLDIETDDKTIKCWVYLYNYPIANLHQITSGNYLEYKKIK